MSKEIIKKINTNDYINLSGNEKRYLHDVVYMRGKDDEGKYTDVLSVIYKDSGGELQAKHIKSPDIDIFFINSEHRNYNYNKSFMDINNCTRVKTNYSRIYNEIAKEAGGESLAFLKNCYETKNIGKLRELNTYKYAFGTDIPIETYYRKIWKDHYDYDGENKKYKIFLDIEVDGIDIVGFPESGVCPINAVSMVDEKSMCVYLFLLNNPDNPLIEEFINNIDDFKNELHESFDDVYGVMDYNIMMYDDELKMIIDVYKLINSLKRDFLLVWRGGQFDIPFIIERIRVLGGDPNIIMTHKDFPLRYIHLNTKDGKLKSASYTKFIDQMELYKDVRIGRGELRSVALNNIGKDVLGDEKIDYSEETNIKRFPYDNYRKFAKYSIKDVLLAYGIEKKVNDVESLYIKIYYNYNDYDSAFKQTVILKSRVYSDYLDIGYILGNNVNIFNIENYSFEGAIVADPLNNAKVGKMIYGTRSKHIFDFVIDMDYASMYPWIKICFNIERHTLIGKLFVDFTPKDYYSITRKENDTQYDSGKDFVEGYISGDVISIGNKWFNLPDILKTKSLIDKTLFGYEMINIDKDISLENNLFVDNWTSTMVRSLSHLYEDIKYKELYAIVKEICLSYIKDRHCIIENNYIGAFVELKLSRVYEWIHQVKPICAGNGTFYENQDKIYDPLNDVVRSFLTNRDKLKKQMYTYEAGSFLYMTYDGKQLSEKTMANSLYGCSGASVSFIFNKFTGASIPATGQSLISSAFVLFESFLSNSIKFNNLMELVTFVDNVKSQEYEFDTDMLPMIPYSEVKNRLLDNLIDFTTEDGEFVGDMIESLPQKIVNKLYYKNNIYEFVKIPKISELMKNILHSSDVFVDPYNPPEKMKEPLQELTDLLIEFVGYNEFNINKIDRFRFGERHAVLGADTDSLMVLIAPWVEFIKNEFILGDNVLINRDEDNSNFISVNIMGYVLTKLVTVGMANYTSRVNLLDEYAGNIKMKNEFLWSRYVSASTKKKYITSVKLREGYEMNPEKLDIKGFEFIKSTASEDTMNKFKGIIVKRLIGCKEIDVKGIINDMNDFEEEIWDSLKNREKKYLQPKSVKESVEYKNPYGEMGFRSAILWNVLYPELPIDLPNKIDIIKLTLDTPEKIISLKGSIDDVIYERLMKIVNNDIKQIQTKMLSSIAIPRFVKEIPEWMIPYIDYDTMCCDVLGKFYPVLESVGMTLLETSNNTYHSNILKL